MNKKTRRIVESSILIAIAFILSMFSFSGPWIKGGSVTVASMLPLIIISFRYGIKWGLFSSFVYSILQAITGASNLSYAPNMIYWILILLLDYLIPFTFIGVSSIFKKFKIKKIHSIFLGIITTFSFRFLCHFLSGWLIWQALWPESGWIPWVYSLAYNASYMLPEIVITMIISYFINKTLTFVFEEQLR